MLYLVLMPGLVILTNHMKANLDTLLILMHLGFSLVQYIETSRTKQNVAALAQEDSDSMKIIPVYFQYFEQLLKSSPAN